MDTARKGMTMSKDYEKGVRDGRAACVAVLRERMRVLGQRVDSSSYPHRVVELELRTNEIDWCIGLIEPILNPHDAEGDDDE